MKKAYRKIIWVTALLFLFIGAVQAEIVEIVVFKSKEGISKETVLSSAREMVETLKSWDGFISRELIGVGDGQWIDVVHWSDMASAGAAQKRAMESERCLRFFSLLEEGDEVFFHGEKVLLQ